MRAAGVKVGRIAVSAERAADGAVTLPACCDLGSATDVADSAGGTVRGSHAIANGAAREVNTIQVFNILTQFIGSLASLSRLQCNVHTVD